MLANKKADVIGFSNGSLYDSIEIFLNDDSFAQSTKYNYRQHLIAFFKFVCKGKSLVDITEDDIKLITHEHVKKYRTYLKKQELKNSTINSKIAAVVSLFKELSKTRNFINPNILVLKPLPEEDNHYGDFTEDEIVLLIEEAKQLYNGEMKSLLIELAVKTSFRQSHLLSLTWNDIKKHDENLYIIKGKKERNKKDEKDKVIEKEFYDRLVKIKYKSFSNKLFGFTGKAATEMINTLVEKLNLDPNGDRNLKFHSLKNFGGNEVYKKSGGDIRMMAMQLNHKSPATSLKYYSRISNKPQDNPSLLVMKKVDDTPIKESTLEELLDAIGECGDHIKMEIINKLQSRK